MLKIIDLRKRKSFALRSTSGQKNNTAIENAVRAIIRSVQTKGDTALFLHTKKFDGVTLKSLTVPQNEIRDAFKNADKKFVTVLKQAAVNIRRFHQQQARKPFTLRVNGGSELRQLFRPIERLGVYVPGGKAAYPSTVLMNVIPAQVAGVKEIHLVSPPDKNGNINRDVLTAAGILGVKNIYRVGGAQAIAALAYGTETIPAVDKIVGPGNIFVATAKRMVYGKVGIDSFAGPSEVVILADNSADPTFVAADLLAQAEHDERAVPILVTPSRSLAIKINSEVRRLLEKQPRKNILALSLKNEGRMYIVASLQQGISVTNELAPEHLEIITTKNEFVLKQVRHAGSIFLGNYSPVAIGDYFAGPNHVLPTERTARFSSPLSVDDFLKKSSVIRYSQKQMEEVADDVALFAEREGLHAHALSLRLRKNKK
ncbi:MAG: histidinol dehydrogenase [Ignavibacteriales bacterium]|nr:histidinol dehydrogenase [Ignavibacteriales bacterium]